MHTTDDQASLHYTHDVSLPGQTKEPAVKPVIHSSQHLASDHEAGRNNDMDVLSIAPRWALCPLGWQAHAIDAWADHPVGVWIARCGHQLSGGTPLYDVPQGQPCPSCARWSRTMKPGASQ